MARNKQAPPWETFSCIWHVYHRDLPGFGQRHLSAAHACLACCISRGRYFSMKRKLLPVYRACQDQNTICCTILPDCPYFGNPRFFRILRVYRWVSQSNDLVFHTLSTCNPLSPLAVSHQSLAFFRY